MGLNTVDINVYYSTFTNVLKYFVHVFYVFNIFLNISSTFFYIYAGDMHTSGYYYCCPSTARHLHQFM